MNWREREIQKLDEALAMYADIKDHISATKTYAYIMLRDVKVAETVNHGVINVDLDADGNAVGIELLTLTPKP